MSLNKVYTDKPNHVKPTETLILFAEVFKLSTLFAKQM